MRTRLARETWASAAEASSVQSWPGARNMAETARADGKEDNSHRAPAKKQEGKPIERPERPKPTNVVNLMDALRQSVEASGASTGSKAKAHAPVRGAAREKTEQPKRKKTRGTG